MENEIKTNELEETKEVVSEEKVEEVKEETAPVEEPQEAEPISYPSSHLENIENARQAFLKLYRTQNAWKWVISFFAIAAVIFGCIVVPNILSGTPSLVVMVSTLAGALTITILYTVLTKKYLHRKMREYFALYYDNINSYVFDEDVKDITMPSPGNIEDQTFLDNNLYKDVVKVGSRGLTEFVYKDIPVAVVDAAAQVRQDKRLAPAYVGKYLFAAANYDFDEPLYIYYKGDKRSLPPTNLDGIKDVHEDKKMIIYSNNKDWKKVISSTVKQVLTSIEMHHDLVDLAISFQKGRMFVCMGYDDPLMVLPLQQQFDPKPTVEYKKDVYKVLKLIEEFNK